MSDTIQEVEVRLMVKGKSRRFSGYVENGEVIITDFNCPGLDLIRYVTQIEKAIRDAFGRRKGVLR